MKLLAPDVQEIMLLGAFFMGSAVKVRELEISAQGPDKQCSQNQTPGSHPVAPPSLPNRPPRVPGIAVRNRVVIGFLVSQYQLPH